MTDERFLSHLKAALQTKEIQEILLRLIADSTNAISTKNDDTIKELHRQMKEDEAMFHYLCNLLQCRKNELPEKTKQLQNEIARLQHEQTELQNHIQQQTKTIQRINNELKMFQDSFAEEIGSVK